MQIVNTIRQLEELLNDARADNHQIGFVPTMGALHEGHLSLLAQSKYENGISVCSIFVNPTQFNNPRDFDSYPRMPEHDASILYSAGCDILFTPLTNEIYPVPDTVIYPLGPITEILEGSFRPGHFNGVASVVKRLFEAVKPTRAYFGLKDYQQYLLIKALVKKYAIPVEIIGCEIVRDRDGLALSSRNLLIKQEDRALATTLYKALLLIKNNYGKFPVEELEGIGKEYLSAHPEIRLEYLSVADETTLQPVSNDGHYSGIRALIAAYLGNVRLIDNMKIA